MSGTKSTAMILLALGVAVSPLSGGATSGVRPADPTARPDWCQGAVQPPLGTPTLPARSAGTPTIVDGNYIWDLMFAYTRQARTDAGSKGALERQLSAGVTEMNDALARSRVPARARLVRIRSLPIDKLDESDFGGELRRLAFRGDGYVEKLPRWRKRDGADFVVIVDGGPYLSGLAFVGGARDLNPYIAYALVGLDFLGTDTNTLAHEIGHTLGLHHPFNTPEFLRSFNTFGYSQGYTNYEDGHTDENPPCPGFPVVSCSDPLPEYFRTLMHPGFSTRMLDQYSNRKIKWMGRRTGSRFADAAKSLRRVMKAASAFESCRVDCPPGDAASATPR